MEKPAYEIFGLEKVYNGKTVLQIERLQFEQGKIHALIGPNGSGKSTLFKLLAFLDNPTAGDIKIFGHDYSEILRDKLNWQRRITLVAQKTFLFNQSVNKNIAYGLKLRGTSSVDIKKMVDETLEWVGMAGFGRQNALTLSGGEAQRVALARAIIFRPDVLFLDEPTANLDPANVTMIENLIEKINRQLGTTIIIITHNLFQARRLTHTATVLMDGQVTEYGPTAELFNGAIDERTRAFIAGELIF